MSVEATWARHASLLVRVQRRGGKSAYRGRDQIIRPVILCGGAGTRLWPLSRQALPKQLLPIVGDESLLQQTARRLSNARFRPIVVVSGEQQRDLVRRQLESANADVEAILLEPEGRNTAPAATLAAEWLARAGKDDPMLLMPSDHVIADIDSFLAALDTGLDHAKQGAIVTFGAKPTEPNTQYGYIEAAGDAGYGDGAFPIARFVEKPDAATAAKYLASGRFFWNAGIFLVKPSTLLGEMLSLLPSTLHAVGGAVAASTRDDPFVRSDGERFRAAQNISIDHAVMEKTDRGVVVPVEMQWSDVGSWDAVWQVGKKDSDGNYIRGDVTAFDTRNCLIRSDDGPTVTAVGLERMAVIAADDAIFVAPLHRSPEVKEVVEALKREGRSCASVPAHHAQPWGTSRSLRRSPSFEVEQLTVDAGAEITRKVEPNCTENWIVAAGTAEISVGGPNSVLLQGQSTSLGAGAEYRLANCGQSPLTVIVVRCIPDVETAS
jgi:mannose-1-phosphate guanylyltransferase/mannose-6-phosphate isomerase